MFIKEMFHFLLELFNIHLMFFLPFLNLTIFISIKRTCNLISHCLLQEAVNK